MAGTVGARGSGPSLAGRFAAAIAVTIGFYALALAMAAALLGAAIAPWVVRGENDLWLTLTGAVLGAAILVAVFPRRELFIPPGVRLTGHDQPRLLGLIDEVADACGERPPDDVYATFQVHAGVMDVGPRLRRRIMVIGLPLLHVVCERGLRGVVAHELGHYAGGDTRLGPWIYRTRAAIGRTIERLTDGDDESWGRTAVRLPFIWYGRAFLRITLAIARAQEFAADAMAVRHAGREAYVHALRRIHAYAPTFDSYWRNEVAPLLSAGRRPPIGEGFRAFVAAEPVDRAATASLARELTEGRTDPYDSHPSLAERIAALYDARDPDAAGLLPPTGDESPPAAQLLDDPLELERAQAVYLFGEEVGELRLVDWDAVGTEVYLDRARRLVSAHGELLDGARAGDLDALVDRLGRIATDLQRREPELEVDNARDFAAALMADGLLVALHERGWSVEAPPAEPVICRRGDDSVAPHVLVHDLREGRVTGEQWRTRADRLGVADLPLAAMPDRA